MLNIHPTLPNGKPCRILCIGAHCDDIEIGCGGTLLRLCEQYPNIICHWLVLCSVAEREAECRSSAASFLGGAMESHLHIYDFKDGYLPYIGGEVKDQFERLKSRINPDIILTHYRHDLHQDHRLVNELTWNTFRNHLILEYEVPKYDGDLGRPGFYVPLCDRHCQSKVDLLTRHYSSQQCHAWFCEQTFRGILKLRGIESGSPSGWAEAFYARKLIW